MSKRDPATSSQASKNPAAFKPERVEPSIEANLNSSAYRLAVLDSDFLMSDSMRGVRFQLEYAKAEEGLVRWGVESTIVVFGSARFRPNGRPDHARWYNEAREFGRIVSECGGALIDNNGGPRQNVIATGGGPGIMEAANRGAWESGAPSVGFNIVLPHEQAPNAYSTPELTFQFHYFAIRKMHLAMRANALVVFPGGFGTMDELFEILCLRQTMKITQELPILLFDEDYWRGLVNFDKFVEAGVIDANDLDLFCFANSAEDAWIKLVDRGLLGVPSKAQ